MEIREKIEGFLLERMRQEGGFSASPLLPSTIEDTYFGVASLKKLNHTLLNDHRKEILSYVSTFITENNCQPVLIYYIYKIFEMIEETIPSYLYAIIKKTRFNHTLYRDIRSIYVFIKLNEYIDNKKEMDYLIQILSDTGIKSVEDVYYKGKIKNNEWKANLDFVLDSQNGDGGFGFYPRTTSFLENTYYALRILKAFEDKYKENINRGMDYIMACYNGRGGFARKPGALATIEATSLAVQIMY